MVKFVIRRRIEPDTVTVVCHVVSSERVVVRFIIEQDATGVVSYVVFRNDVA